MCVGGGLRGVGSGYLPNIWSGLSYMTTGPSYFLFFLWNNLQFWTIPCRKIGIVSSKHDSPSYKTIALEEVEKC